MRSSLPKSCCLVFLFLFVLPLWSIEFIREGVHGLQEARSFQHPIVLTFDQFEKAHPTEGWYRITHCFLDVPSAAFWQLKIGHSDSASSILKIYIPVRSQNNPTETKIHMLVPSTDPSLSDTMAQLEKLGKSASEAQIKAWMQEHHSQLLINKDIEGMVRTPDHLMPGDQAGIDPLTHKLAPDYVVIEQDVTPTTTEPKVWLGLGIFLIVAQVLFWGVMIGIRIRGKAARPQ